MRRFFTSWKALALAAALLASGIVWLATRGPREPVYEGKKLSWWLTESAPGGTRLTRAQLQTLGPGAVDWLAFKAIQTFPRDEDLSKPARIQKRIRTWIRSLWFSESEVDALLEGIRLRDEALHALFILGPDAAPAVPSLLKILEGPDYGTHDAAAVAIMTTGAAGWPLAADAILHADPRTRAKLLDRVDWRWSDDQPPRFGPGEFAEMIAFLEPLTSDPNEKVRWLAQGRLKDCVKWWSHQPDCAEGVRLMLGKFPQFHREGRWKALEALAFRYFPNADTIIPHLTALAATTSDDQTRVRILHALGQLDPDDPEWLKQLKVLAASPDSAVAEAAQAALDYRREPHDGVIFPSTHAGPAAPAKTP